MPQPDLVVVEVMRRRDLHAAGAECGVDIVIGDDRDAPTGQRQVDQLADEMPVAFVVGVYGDGGVAEHGLGARGGDDQRTGAVGQRIAHMPEVALFFLGDSTSRSDTAVCSTGSQFTRRLPR